MKIITNKFVVSLFIINILYILVGYFRILDTTRYLSLRSNDRVGQVQ